MEIMQEDNEYSMALHWLGKGNSNLIAVMEAALKQIRKIGTNHNQAVKCINEKMKMSPLAFLPSDLLPFNEFAESMKTVENMLRYLHNMIKE